MRRPRREHGVASNLFEPDSRSLQLTFLQKRRKLN